MRFERKKFFDSVKKDFGRLSQAQVDGLEFLVTSFENDPKWKDVRHIAYALATVKHETADTYKPIKEYRSRVGSKGRANQDRYWLSGYYGRGYVQLTWKQNYEKFGLADRPDDAMKPEEAFKILSVGMQVGSFTGKKLSDYIKGSTCDYKGARKVINGTDKNVLIAGYAVNFEKALRTASSPVASLSSEKTAEPTVIPDEPANSTGDPIVNVENVENVNIPAQPVETKNVTVADQKTSIWAKVGAGFAALTGAGINWWGVLEAKFNALEPRHFLYVILGLGLVALALYIYDRAGKRAHERTMELIKAAEDPNKNTVVIK